MKRLLNTYLQIGHSFPRLYGLLRRNRLFRSICRFTRYQLLSRFYHVSSSLKKNRNEQVCTLPWERAAIKSDGRVTCSTYHRNRPELNFGNIIETPFSNIWRGRSFSIHRTKIADPEGTLPYLCYTCPYKVEAVSASEFPKEPLPPRVLWVETTDSCGLDCPSCISRDERTGAMLPIDAFKRTLDAIGKDLDTLLFYIDGENYLHPRATEMTRYARQVNGNMEIISSTNGLCFNSGDERRDFVLSGVNSVIFSIDGATQESYQRYRKGGDLKRALDNLRGVIELRNRLEVPMHVQWRYILFRWNDSEKEMDLARRTAEELGVDSLVWLMTNTVDRSKRFPARNISVHRTKLAFERFEAAEAMSSEICLQQRFR